MVPPGYVGLSCHCESGVSDKESTLIFEEAQDTIIEGEQLLNCTDETHASYSGNCLKVFVGVTGLKGEDISGDG